MMLAPLQQFAGFLCDEGQPAANMKQMLYTFLVLVIVMWLLALTRESPRKKLFWFIIIPLGSIFILATLIIGPFFYSSWGCDNDIGNFFFDLFS